MISDPDVLVSVDMMYREAVATCLTTYEHLIAQGVAPEQARFVLPLGTMTEFIWTGSLAAYARVFQLRTSPDAQQECRTIAYKIGAIVARHFPISWAALVQRSIA